ncbi:MAG: type II secretion system protein GspG [Desulfomonilia bacterium]|jgi:general secretion pathway protein G|nr:type II secretion system protein GspG [Deltaproteobacteria bacterium]
MKRYPEENRDRLEMREKDHYHSLLPRVLWSNRALTLLELILVVAILGTVSGIAIPSFLAHRDKVLAQEAISDIAAIDLVLQKYYAENGKFPDSLAEIGQDGNKDPWGNPYQYLNLANDPKKNKCRKNKKIHPINTDFDLYSMGKNGKSTLPITSQPSWDDIIRAYDGVYIGLVKDIL